MYFVIILSVLITTCELQEQVSRKKMAVRQDAEKRPGDESRQDMSLPPGEVLFGTLNSLLTTPIIIQDSQYKELEEEMRRRHIGYMALYLEVLCRIVIDKSSDDLKPITSNLVAAFHGLKTDGKLFFLEEPLTTWLTGFLGEVQKVTTEKLKKYASVIQSMLRSRDEIEQQFDMMLTEADDIPTEPLGEALFHSLGMLRKYTKDTTDVKPDEICKSFVEVLANAFTDSSKEYERSTFISHVNKLLSTRYLQYQKDIPDDSNKAPAVGELLNYNHRRTDDTSKSSKLNVTNTTK